MLYIILFIIGMIMIGIVSRLGTRKRLVNTYPGYLVEDIQNGFLVYDDDEIKVIRGRTTKEFFKNDIDKYEIYVDEKTVSHGKRALAGALMFGAAGAVVGAVSGKQKISKLGMKLYVSGEYIDINFLQSPSKKKSVLYQLADSSIHRFIAMLEKAN